MQASLQLLHTANRRLPWASVAAASALAAIAYLSSKFGLSVVLGGASAATWYSGITKWATGFLIIAGLFNSWTLASLAIWLACAAALSFVEGSPVEGALWLVGAVFVIAVAKRTLAARPVRMQGQAVATPQAPGQAAATSSGLRFKAQRPQKTFASIWGMQQTKVAMLQAGRDATAHAGKGNGILLFGEPGNGKTALAEALAGEMQLPWISLSIADIVSRYLGGGPESLAEAFAAARAQAPCVLFIDEADSVFASREGENVHQDMVNLTNVFLAEAVKLRGTGVLLIAATNSLDRMDGAAIREGRFDSKIEVPAPDEAARIGILGDGVKNLRLQTAFDPELLRSIARRWEGFSVARLLAVVDKLRIIAAAGPINLDYDTMLQALRQVQGHSTVPAEGAKSLDELSFGAEIRGQLHGIAVRLKRAFEIELHGGAVPRGVLLYGLPGTGKTKAAVALAKESGWTFLATTGQELMSAGKLDQLMRKARDLRPTLVFIDEAEDLLRNRSFGLQSGVTNQLLNAMDGEAGRVPDVVFVAATNHPDAVDPAFLRGGRFEEKIGFQLPGVQTFMVHAVRWAEAKGWALSQGAIDALRDQAGDVSVADLEAALQAAVNGALASAMLEGRQVVKTLQPSDIDAGLRSIGLRG